MVALVILIFLLIVDIIIYYLVKYKEEIWYAIYKRMGWLEDDSNTVYKNKKK